MINARINLDNAPENTGKQRAKPWLGPAALHCWCTLEGIRSRHRNAEKANVLCMQDHGAFHHVLTLCFVQSSFCSVSNDTKLLGCDHCMLAVCSARGVFTRPAHYNLILQPGTPDNPHCTAEPRSALEPQLLGCHSTPACRAQNN